MAKKDKEKVKNIRERDGKYYFRYSIKVTKNGKKGRKQKETQGFDTLEEAQNEGVRIKAAILDGSYIDESDITLSQWVEKWIKEYYSITGKVKGSTIKVRRDSLKIAETHFGKVKLKDITMLQYQAFLNGMKTAKTLNGQKEGYSEKSIRMVHEAMKLLFRKAKQLKLIANNITLEAEMPGFQQTVEELENEEELPEYMEKEQLALFLKTALEYGDIQAFRALFTLSYTGMRIGELCSLKISDLDEVNKRISITKTLHHRGAYENHTVGTPKTPSSKRKIDLGKSVMKILRDQLAWRKAYKFSIGDAFYNKAEYLFVNEKQFPGYPMSPRELSEIMKKVLEKADLPSSLSPHSLRHTYTSLMAEAGVELPAIQRLLGHQDDTMTKRVYLHVTEPKKREAVDKLDDLMKDFL